jgi:AraC-like DNA-binding protein
MTFVSFILFKFFIFELSYFSTFFMCFMTNAFQSSSHGPLQLHPGLPGGFKGPFLAGSEAFHFSKDYGSLVLQKVTTEEFSLQLLLIHFLQKVRISTSLLSGFHSIFSAKGHTWHEFLDHKKVHLRESQFFFLQEKEVEWKIELHPKVPLQLVQLSYGEEASKELATAFPSWEPFLLGRQRGIKGPYSSHGTIRDAVHKILHADYEPERLPLYFKNRVGDYMFELLEQATEKEREKPVATAWEQRAVQKVREMILENILEHHSITELAKKARIDQYRLKIFFKKEFGVGPYEFLLHTRLDKAKELIEGGMPMKQAAPLAGYRTTSFITAFKRRFGYSPGKIQRKGGGD